MGPISHFAIWFIMVTMLAPIIKLVFIIFINASSIVLAWMFHDPVSSEDKANVFLDVMFLSLLCFIEFLFLKVLGFV